MKKRITLEALGIGAALRSAAGGRMSAEGAGRDERELNMGIKAAQGRKASLCLSATSGRSGKSWRNLEGVRKF